ncbi:MAG: glycosyltransferase [Candidatus Pacebacteria bacterium]|nr:glycosyltransferase [Candidatus Paceibacterota bacterium]
MSDEKKIKVAIVHDFLTYFGGAEQVLKSMHNLYPEAPIYTLLYDETVMKKYFPEAKIKASFLNKLPKFIRKRKKFMLPLFSTAIETFDLSGYDLVLSSSSSFAKGVIVRPRTVHLCYCHAPARFLWDWYYNYLAENKIGGIKKIFVISFLHFLRIWDRSASDRVDFYIANSKNTSRKIKKFYGRDSVVIYPPVDQGGVSNKKMDIKMPEGYYLIVSRLSPYKKIDVAIKAFNKLGLPLVIIGEGSDRKRLEKMAGANITFIGFQSEEVLSSYYANCRAFVFPGEDDFGITIVEAMSFGKPVLAYRKGGVLETVIEGETGEFFDAVVPEILADGIRKLNKNIGGYDAEKIKNRAERFSRKRFETDLRDFIESSASGS